MSSPFDTNFSQISNEDICTCGEHHGTGEWSPKKRAAVYARMRDKLRTVMTPAQESYLASWEAEHGKVNYLMEVVGVDDGEFRKSSKGKPIYGAVFQEEAISYSRY